MANIVLGIDIGGTNTKIGAVNRAGEILVERSFPTVCQEGVNQFLNNLNFGIHDLLSILDNAKLVGIGVGAPCVNSQNGHIEYAANLLWDQVINIKIYLGNLHNVPVEVTNDANLPAIGEMLYGKAKKMNDFMTISLGTGLGCGIVANGRLVVGHQGLAGELGHVIVKTNGRLCGCGRKGCLETYVSATGIKRTFYKLLADYNGGKSQLSGIGFDSLSAECITQAAQSGDELALEAFAYTGDVLGTALADAVTFTNPEAVFLVGGLAQSGSLLFKPTKKSFESGLLKNLKNNVELMPSALPLDKLPILGGSALIWNSIEAKAQQMHTDDSSKIDLTT